MDGNKTILAIDLRSRSFGFVVFEGSTLILDCGVKSFRQGVNAVKIPAGVKFIVLMDEFSPNAIVLRKPGVESEKKRAMRRALLGSAEARHIPIRLVSIREVKRAFQGSNRNRHVIAVSLAKQLLELAPRLPNARKIWSSEDFSMSIFDAAALGVAYFSRTGSSNRSMISDRGRLLAAAAND